MLKSILRGFSDTYIQLKGTITIAGRGADKAARQEDKRNKEVIFKNCALFIEWISEINNTRVDNAKDTDIVVPIKYVI